MIASFKTQLAVREVKRGKCGVRLESQEGKHCPQNVTTLHSKKKIERKPFLLCNADS